MSAELRSRFYATMNDTFGTGLRQDIVLQRDVVDLNLALRKTTAQDLQQILYTATLAASTGVTFSLNDAANAVKDAGNNPLRIAKLLFCLITIVTPAVGTAVRFGPQGVANAAPLWFSGVTADEWVSVTDVEMRVMRPGGWAVDSANANVRLYNPSLVSATVRLWLLGEKQA